MNTNQKSSEAAYLDLRSKYKSAKPCSFIGNLKSSEAAYLDLRSKYKSSKYKLYKLFSLIEVALALAIVALGVVSIMALFPVGFQASRDAMGDNYSADAADQMLHYLVREFTADSSFGATLDPDSEDGKPVDDETEGLTYPDDLDSSLGGALYEFGADTDFYFAIKQGTSTVTDFAAIMTVWREIIDIDSNGSIDATDRDAEDFCTRFCMEISWPPEKPYERRVKKLYAMEAFYSK